MDIEYVSDLDFEGPGTHDRAYQERRRVIAEISRSYNEGGPVPRVEYSADEHGVWSEVLAALRPLHRRLASRVYLRALERLELDPHELPQLCELNPRLRAATGFEMRPVVSFVSPRAFLERLGRGIFLATQYVRHGEAPRFSKEPDVVHEIVGHGPTFMDPVLAELHRGFGRVASHASAEELARLERVYWYTMEAGMIVEGGQVRVLGQALLSSADELARVEGGEVELLPFDLRVMGEAAVKPTRVQDALFVAPSFDAFVAELRAWLAELGDGGG